MRSQNNVRIDFAEPHCWFHCSPASFIVKTCCCFGQVDLYKFVSFMLIISWVHIFIEDLFSRQKAPLLEIIIIDGQFQMFVILCLTIHNLKINFTLD